MLSYDLQYFTCIECDFSVQYFQLNMDLSGHNPLISQGRPVYRYYYPHLTVEKTESFDSWAKSQGDILANEGVWIPLQVHLASEPNGCTSLCGCPIHVLLVSRRTEWSLWMSLCSPSSEDELKATLSYISLDCSPRTNLWQHSALCTSCLSPTSPRRLQRKAVAWIPSPSIPYTWRM